MGVVTGGGLDRELLSLVLYCSGSIGLGGNASVAVLAREPRTRSIMLGRRLRSLPFAAAALFVLVPLLSSRLGRPLPLPQPFKMLFRARGSVLGGREIAACGGGVGEVATERGDPARRIWYGLS